MRRKAPVKKTVPASVWAEHRDHDVWTACICDLHIQIYSREDKACPYWLECRALGIYDRMAAMDIESAKREALTRVWTKLDRLRTEVYAEILGS